MKILIATDGSDYSKAAIDALANVVANPETSAFKIVSSVEFPAMPLSDPFFGASAE
jgi:flagellar basal body rod protein FlgG